MREENRAGKAAENNLREANDFSRELEQLHQRLICDSSVESRSNMTSDGRDSLADLSSHDAQLSGNPVVTAAIPVLKLLEEVRQFQVKTEHAATDATVKQDELSDTPGSDAFDRYVFGSNVSGSNCIGSDDPQSSAAAAESFAAGHQPLNDGSEAGLRLGRFQLLERLGQGGFGIVMRAVDTRLHRDVAIKLLRLEASLSDSAIRRFEREAHAAALLSHPNIVPVYESGLEDGMQYLVSEYVPGCNLAIKLSQVQRYRADDATRLIKTLADSMAHAHQRGVLHRDLKPANILIDDRTNEPRITDFGMATLLDDFPQMTQTGATVGTPAYMAPEQAKGKGELVGPATDVYGLGAILYQLLTGRAPFSMPTVLETLQAVAETDPLAPTSIEPSIPRDLEAICLKCLEKSTHRRYASARELELDLNRFLAKQPVIARPVSSFRKVLRWVERHPALVAVSTLLAIAMTMGLVVSLLMWRQSYRNWQLAESRAGELREEVAAKQEALKTVDLQSRDLASQAARLQAAIDRLFVVVAESPEIQTVGVQPLRTKLLEQARDYYIDILQVGQQQETTADSAPATADLQLAKTLLSLGHVFQQLGDFVQAQQLSTQLLNILPTEDAAAGLRIIRSEAHALAARAYISQRNADEALEHVELCLLLTKTYGSNSKTDQERLAYVRGLATASLVNSLLGERTKANQYARQALDKWKSFQETFNSLTELRELASIAVLSAKALAASEKKDEAASLLTDAITILEAAMAKGTQLPTTVQRLAEAHRVHGFLLGNNWPEAERAFIRSSELYEQLIANHPLVPLYQLDQLGLAYSYGLAEYLNKRIDQAEERFQNTVHRAEEIAKRFPESSAAAMRPAVNSLTMLAFVYRGRGNSEKELETLQISLQLNMELATQANHTPATQVAVAGVTSEIAVCLSNQNLHPQAIEKFDESDQILRTILAQDPENGEARRFLSNNLYNAHQSLVALNRHDDAYERVDQSLALSNDLESQLAILKQVEISTSGGRWEQAARCLDEFASIEWSTPTQLKRAVADEWKLLKYLQTLDSDAIDKTSLTTRLRQLSLATLDQLAQHHSNEEQPWQELFDSELYSQVVWPELEELRDRLASGPGN